MEKTNHHTEPNNKKSWYHGSKRNLGLDIPVTSTCLQKNQVLFAMYVCKFSPPSSIGSVFVCDWTVYLERKSVPLMMWRISPWFLGLITPASGHSWLDFFPFWICTILMFVSKKQLLGESWSGQMIMFHQARFPLRSPIWPDLDVSSFLVSLVQSPRYDVLGFVPLIDLNRTIGCLRQVPGFETGLQFTKGGWKKTRALA